MKKGRRSSKLRNHSKEPSWSSVLSEALAVFSAALSSVPELGVGELLELFVVHCRVWRGSCCVARKREGIASQKFKVYP
jgi:hypothetical protein